MVKLVGYDELGNYILERPPLLMVDRLELDIAKGTGTGVKAVSMDENFFQGHFPGSPIMPGVLQVAAMMQVGSALVKEVRGDNGAPLYPWLRTVKRTKFRKPVLPGDFLVIQTELLEDAEGGAAVIRGRTVVGETVTCQAELEIASIAPEQLALAPAALMAPRHEIPGLEITGERALDVLEVMQAIPHRFPFLLVDRILDLDMDTGRAIAIKNVTGNEPFFAHAQFPFMPLYLELEAAAQVACVVALKTPGNEDKLGYFMAIDHGHTLRPIVPGDQILMDVTLTGRGRFGVAEGRLYVGDTVVTELALKFVLVERD